MRAPDPESSAWVASLSGSGRERDEAVERLHALLSRAARFELARRHTALDSSVDIDQLTADAAHDALMAVMAKLHTYRGQSRFTTWAYKFALLEASVKARRRAWRGRELPLEPDEWTRLPDLQEGPDVSAETGELIDALRRGIQDALTDHQRRVLVSLTLDDVPIDVLAERLDTTRGALYKTLHDARRKLREQLAEEGLVPAQSRKEAA